MRSDSMKRAMERAPHRSLPYAPGCDEQDVTQSFIGIVNSYSEIVPGHKHMRDLATAAKEGIRSAGGTP